MPLPAGVQQKWPVAILGATGAVGQTFVRLLAGHPWFEIAELAASERSAGRRYGDVVKWLEGELPHGVADIHVTECSPVAVRSALVFSALDSSVASEVELAFAGDGRMVLSNAQNFRMTTDVPLVIPEVNGDHLDLLDRQRELRGWDGGIVTNANCAATVVAMGLAPLHQAFGVKRLFLTTMQAISGAGYPGVPSLDILGNVIPFIRNEEEKVEAELGKLLGKLSETGIVTADFPVSAHTNRVHVRHGHSACLSVELMHDPGLEEAAAAMRSWRGDARCEFLPSAPVRPLYVHDEADRPQPARDVDREGGMSVSVGRIRRDPIFHLRLFVLGHNTIRGAAGGSVLNAELLAVENRLPGAR